MLQAVDKPLRVHRLPYTGIGSTERDQPLGLNLVALRGRIQPVSIGFYATYIKKSPIFTAHLHSTRLVHGRLSIHPSLL